MIADTNFKHKLRGGKQDWKDTFSAEEYNQLIDALTNYQARIEALEREVAALKGKPKADTPPYYYGQPVFGGTATQEKRKNDTFQGMDVIDE